MKKETAVEWLIDELRKVIVENGRLDAISISQLKMKAKAMEKQQIIDAYNNADFEWTNKDFEHGWDYFDQTYEQ